MVQLRLLLMLIPSFVSTDAASVDVETGDLTGEDSSASDGGMASGPDDSSPDNLHPDHTTQDSVDESSPAAASQKVPEVSNSTESSRRSKEAPTPAPLVTLAPGPTQTVLVTSRRRSVPSSLSASDPVDDHDEMDTSTTLKRKQDSASTKRPSRKKGRNA